MSKRKAQLVTAIIAAFVLLVCVDLVALYPKATIWILGAFAVPGAWKFCRTCYIWLTIPDDMPKTSAYYARVPGRHKKKEEPPAEEAPQEEATHAEPEGET